MDGALWGAIGTDAADGPGAGIGVPHPLQNRAPVALLVWHEVQSTDLLRVARANVRARIKGCSTVHRCGRRRVRYHLDGAERTWSRAGGVDPRGRSVDMTDGPEGPAEPPGAMAPGLGQGPEPGHTSALRGTFGTATRATPPPGAPSAPTPSPGASVFTSLSSKPIGPPPPDRATPAKDDADFDSAARSASLFVGPADDPDRYRLLHVISRGGEGELWKGHLSIDGVPIAVAVKVIHPSNAVNMAEWRRRWQRQAELLRSLDHPGLVRVRDCFEGPVPHTEGSADRSSRSLLLIMNWVDGMTLEQWVASEPHRSLLTVLGVIDSIGSALDYLHGGIAGRPIVHRDIKPANVIIDGGAACLVDFGFARILSGEPMTLVGTPSYLAPEVIANGLYSEASDRYSFGGTAFFAITGQRPIRDDWDNMRRTLAAVPEIGANADLIEAILMMLVPDPLQRPRNARDWVRALKELAAVAAPAPQMWAPPPDDPGRRRKRWR